MREQTYDCAFLEPLLAFPPDLPPVILDELGGFEVDRFIWRCLITVMDVSHGGDVW
jgi:hypothetical protein